MHPEAVLAPSILESSEGDPGPGGLMEIMINVKAESWKTLRVIKPVVYRVNSL